MPRVFKIKVNDTEYNVTVEELTSGPQPAVSHHHVSSVMSSAPASLAAAAHSTAASPSSPPPVSQAGSGDQCAQMAGVVSNIFVKEGQAVSEGEKVLELEAMKMKIPVTANRSGKVTRILVSVGDSVAGEQPLLTIS